MHWLCTKSLLSDFWQQNVSSLQVKRSRSLGYVAPAKHPAPFDTRVVAGSLPQYEKVVHKATDESFLYTLAKHEKAEEIRQLADALTQPSTATTRRRWSLKPDFKSTPDLARIPEEPDSRPKLVRNVTKVLQESEIKFQRPHTRPINEHSRFASLNRIRAFIEVN